jgi:hypothetical protein
MGLRGPRAYALGRQPKPLRVPKFKPPSAVNGSEEPSAHALWQRSYRARLREGIAIVSVPIGWQDIELLVRAKCLDGRADFYDREEVARALKEFLRLARE